MEDVAADVRPLVVALRVPVVEVVPNRRDDHAEEEPRDDRPPHAASRDRPHPRASARAQPSSSLFRSLRYRYRMPPRYPPLEKPRLHLSEFLNPCHSESTWPTMESEHPTQSMNARRPVS